MALIEIENNNDALSQIHREFNMKSTKALSSSVHSHNQKTGIRAVNFSTGGYVFKGLLQKYRKFKLSLRSPGSFQVTERL